MDSHEELPVTRIPFRFAAALALLSTSQLQAAAPVKPCMTQTELRGMVAYVMPSAMATLIGRCQPVLPAGASMLVRGAQLAAELESGRAAAFPLARRAFAKFSDTGDKMTGAMMQALPEAALRPLIDDTISRELTGSIKVNDCPDIDRIFAALAPLPAINFVDLFTQAIAIGTRDNKDMSVCPI